MFGFLAKEKGSASSVELTLILPSLIIMLVSTFDFVWISLHELSAQFVATRTVRDINVNGFTSTAPIITRARSFLLDIGDDQIEICSDVTVTSSVDPDADLCPDGSGNPGKNAGGSLSLVVVRIRPLVNTIFLQNFFSAFDRDFQPEGIAIGRNEPT